MNACSPSAPHAAVTTTASPAARRADPSTSSKSPKATTTSNMNNIDAMTGAKSPTPCACTALT
jgi:hypothetical protein